MMTEVKIKSNPYDRNISFYTRKQSSDEWIHVNNINNPDSNLIRDSIRKNFFPYKVKEVIQIILREYAVHGEKTTIVFAGTSDEYKELADVCEEYEEIMLKRDEELLENARDILPQIVDIFYKIKPIIDTNIEKENVREDIEKDIAKFLDASNDIIPICVLGNYSSGKSTFINALIGLEILPSGDEPITAKIYQIKKSGSDNDTSIEFYHNGTKMHIAISEKGYAVAGDDAELKRNLQRVLSEQSEKSLSEKVNACLTTINEEKESVSDLIEIQIPFGKGFLGEVNNSFVIFDTPGSNAAMHQDHFTILKGAMRNLSNGIPIYVTEYNALDSCDNENLYESIKNISQIDTRFTMIAVNKADLANIKDSYFDETAEQKILCQTVPHNLYSGGIYFVSSIMGLGSKTEKFFIDEHLDEMFEDNELKYKEPSNKWYKTLYKYNIMPEQIKRKIVDASESADNIIFANSGLLAIEHEIISFAEKYSAYDKCKQSNRYIEEIIEATQSEIVEAQTISETNKSQIERELEEDKRQLIESMENRSNELKEGFVDAYIATMRDCYLAEQFKYDPEDMKALEKSISDDRKAANDYEDYREEFRQSRAAVIDSIGQPLDVLVKGVMETWDDYRELKDIKTRADIETSDELIRGVTEDFNKRGSVATSNIDMASREYWEDNTEKVKKELVLIVAESPTLDDDKKRELEEIIISYDKVQFTDQHVFEKAHFERKLMLLGREIDLNRLNIRKLADTYNKDYAAAIKKVYEEIRTSHKDSFEKWRSQLVGKIRTNIVDYSPKLSEKARRIEEETKRIGELSDTVRLLSGYSDEIQELMSWK